MTTTFSTQTQKKIPKPFNVYSDEDDKDLNAWCRLHWQSTFCKGVQGNNAPTYHDCCVTFSKKNCIKRSTHSVIQSASVLMIPKLNIASNPEELYRWLKERLRVHNLHGRRTYFPSINVAHFNDDEDIHKDRRDEMETLGKRYSTTLLELEKGREELSRLKEDNQRLLAASKSWCAKYQELLFKTQDETASYTQSTPIKPLKQQQQGEFIKL